MERQKKPPIDIRELNKKETPEPKPGPLSYVSSEVPKGKGGKPNYLQIALSVGLSVMVLFILSTFMFLGKKDGLTLLDNQKLLEEKVESISSRISENSNRIDNIIGAYATRSEVDTLKGEVDATKSEFDTLKSEVDTLPGEVDTKLGSFKDEFRGEIEALLAEWEEEKKTPSSTLDYYLTEDKTGYYLHIESSRDGAFIGRVVMIYTSPPIVGEAGYSINDAMKAYYGDYSEDTIPTIRFKDGKWEVIQVSFYTDSFKLEAGKARKLEVTFPSELPSADYGVYIEVLPKVGKGIDEESEKI